MLIIFDKHTSKVHESYFYKHPQQPHHHHRYNIYIHHHRRREYDSCNKNKNKNKIGHRKNKIYNKTI